MLKETEQRARAAEELQAGLALRPDRPFALLDLAQAALAAEDVATARRSLETLRFIWSGADDGFPPLLRAREMEAAVAANSGSRTATSR